MLIHVSHLIFFLPENFFNISFRVVLSTVNSLSSDLSENIFISSSFLRILLPGIELWVDFFFLSALERCHFIVFLLA